MFKLVNKKIIAILAEKFCLTGPIGRAIVLLFQDTSHLINEITSSAYKNLLYLLSNVTSRSIGFLVKTNPSKLL